MRGFVNVQRTFEEDEDGSLLEYPPKNGKARVVPLPAAACDELRVWLAAQKEYRLAQGPAWNEAGRVVPKKDGSRMAPSSLKSQWWNWVARQRIDPHLPIHGLRDSFGTCVYEAYAVKQAQEWLGHSDPATTLRHYVRLMTAARAKAVAELDEVTRAALEAAEEKAAEDAQPVRDNVVALLTSAGRAMMLDFHTRMHAREAELSAAVDEASIESAMRVLQTIRSVFDPGALRRPSQFT